MLEAKLVNSIPGNSNGSLQNNLNVYGKLKIPLATTNLSIFSSDQFITVKSHTKITNQNSWKIAAFQRRKNYDCTEKNNPKSISFRQILFDSQEQWFGDVPVIEIHPKPNFFWLESVGFQPPGTKQQIHPARPVLYADILSRYWTLPGNFDHHSMNLTLTTGHIHQTSTGNKDALILHPTIKRLGQCTVLSLPTGTPVYLHLTF